MSANNLRLFPSVGLELITSDDWYTPRDVIACARNCLGDIDLDPCSCAAANELIKAATFYDRNQDGLVWQWSGRVWLNPPYSDPKPWTDKLIYGYRAGDVTAAVALIADSTDTEAFQRLAKAATVMFTRNRIHFWRPDREARNPSQGNALFYLGPNRQRFFESFSSIAYMVNMRGL